MIKVGCCGFPKSRQEYYRTFQTVEIQQTFYQLPTLKTVERWRRDAPEDFEFTLKAWQLITHEAKSPTYRRLTLRWPQSKLNRCGSFRPTKEVQWAWDQTWEVARTLRAKLLVFQTPASFHPSPENKKNLRTFFTGINRGDFILIWEPRGTWKEEEVGEICQDLNLIHGVDPFKNEPQFGALRYFRLHGIGGYRYRFNEGDLKLLREKCRGECYCMFNNVSMWEDALTFQKLVRQEKS